MTSKVPARDRPTPASRWNFTKVRPSSRASTGYRAPPYGAAFKVHHGLADQEHEKSPVSTAAHSCSSPRIRSRSASSTPPQIPTILQRQVDVFGRARLPQAQLHRVAALQRPPALPRTNSRTSRPVEGDLPAKTLEIDQFLPGRFASAASQERYGKRRPSHRSGARS